MHMILLQLCKIIWGSTSKPAVLCHISRKYSRVSPKNSFPQKRGIYKKTKMKMNAWNKLLLSSSKLHVKISRIAYCISTGEFPSHTSYLLLPSMTKNSVITENPYILTIENYCGVLNIGDVTPLILTKKKIFHWVTTTIFEHD